MDQPGDEWDDVSMNGQFDLGDVSPTKYFLSIAIVLGILFTLVAPDNEDAFLITLLQWLTQTIVPIMLLILSHTMLSKLSVFDRLNPWVKLTGSGLIGVVLFSPLALLLDEDLALFASISDLAIGLLNEIVGMGPIVIVCWVAINAPWLMGFQLKKTDVIRKTNLNDQESKPNHESRPNNGPRPSAEGYSTKAFGKFGELIPSEIGSDIVFLKAELHYLQVTTVIGKALILYNLKDAIDDVSSISGIHCHRSYWVALSHIKEVSKQGRQGKIELSTGDFVPVSRRNLDATMATTAQIEGIHTQTSN